jgi:hypothetical protein
MVFSMGWRERLKRCPARAFAIDDEMVEYRYYCTGSRAWLSDQPPGRGHAESDAERERESESPGGISQARTMMTCMT